MIDKAKQQAELLRQTSDLLDKESMAYFPSENFHVVADLLEELARQLESAQPKWISVEERLPEEGIDVLVWRDGCFAIAHIICGDDWTYTGIGGDPVYWCPLPRPPEEV